MSYDKTRRTRLSDDDRAWEREVAARQERVGQRVTVHRQSDDDRESTLTSWSAVAFCFGSGHEVVRVEVARDGRAGFVFRQRCATAPESLSETMARFVAFRDWATREQERLGTRR